MTSSAPSVNPGDIESQVVFCKRRNCLDCCLVISVLVLAVTVGSLCALYLILDRPLMERIVREQKIRQPTSAHLLPTNGLLKNGTLYWLHTYGIGNVFVGPDFNYDAGDLVVGRTGLYYVYSQLALACKSIDGCPPDGSMSLTVQKKSHTEETSIFTLNIQVPKSSKTTFSGAVHLFSAGERLSAKLWTDRPHQDWQLDRENTFMGLFWISENTALELEH